MIDLVDVVSKVVNALHTPKLVDKCSHAPRVAMADTAGRVQWILRAYASWFELTGLGQHKLAEAFARWVAESDDEKARRFAEGVLSGRVRTRELGLVGTGLAAAALAVAWVGETPHPTPVAVVAALARAGEVPVVAAVHEASRMVGLVAEPPAEPAHPPDYTVLLYARWAKVYAKLLGEVCPESEPSVKSTGP